MKTILAFVCSWLGLVGLFGCGKGYVDPVFAPFVQKFENEGHLRGWNGDVSNAIKFGSTATEGNGVAGFCSGGTILIDETTWNGLSDDGKEELLFHELGHCTLGRDHDKDTSYSIFTQSSTPTSIMYPTLIPQMIYASSRSAYLDELFKK